MIVEDSLVVRQLLIGIVQDDPRLVVAAAVASAEEALTEIHRVAPDVISMDIRLPGMDGLEATRRIMEERPTPVVVFADSVNDASLKISMNALRAGALTVVEKPVGVGSAGFSSIASTICTQLYIMSQVPVIRRRNIGGNLAREAPIADRLPARGPEPGFRPSIFAVAASTGGPPAFAKLLGSLPRDFPLPILLVQHMGEAFMEGFAQWLDGLVPLKVRLAQHGEAARPGTVHVAPGGQHLLLGPGNSLHLSQGAPVHSQRPSATVMFQSMARVPGLRAIGAVLTGMGEDGALGLTELRRAGSYVIAEHESTTVVYGMPAAAVRMGAVNESLPLDKIASRVLRILGREAAE